MAKFEVLSAEVEHQFPGRLFEIMPEDHFWVRSRFKVFMQEARKLGIDLTDRKVGFDIGCAHGVVQRQLAAHSAWSADGCDLMVAGLAKNSGHSGRVFYYNVMDRRPELYQRYDFLVVFDVLEHIHDTTLFLNAALFHLKPGGYVFVNVPAIQALYSRFDDVLGHVRRYDRGLLSRHLVDAGLDVLSVRYWALTMIPLIYARALLVNFFTDADKILDVGFKPPGRLIAAALSGLLSLETWAFRSPPIGTCLLAVAQKANDPTLI
jgi:2-polyprenyl-3-methyl-5-hydroxy-6-metoxy-1,4-benzoquinol methylase